MADVNEVSKLTVAQLKELAQSANVEVGDNDKKDVLVEKVSNGITPEQLADFLTAVEGDGNVDVTPVAPEEPTPSEEDTAVDPEAEAKAAEEARKAAEEQEAENARIAAEAQAAEKAKADAEAEAAAQVPTPAENAGSDIARAIAEGMKGATEKNFSLQPDAGVEPRFSVVRNKATGEVMLRENETGHLSKVQLESIEEKEASIQGSEVEEI